jgi:DNA-binding SARP family transcriptional activator
MNMAKYLGPSTDRPAVMTREVGPASPLPTSTPPLRFAGFGRFRVEIDGRLVQLPPITCTVLARLLLARGGLVLADALYRDAWPGPELAVRREQRVAVHKRVSELRRYLEPACPGNSRSLLTTDRAARTGYRMLVDPDQVDLYRFEDLIARAGATQDLTTIDLLSQALSLWRERPLLDLPDRPFVRDAVSRLVTLRDRACRELAAACRALGRARQALAVFDQLLARQPDDAALHGLVEQLRRDISDRADDPAGRGGAFPAMWQVPRRMIDQVSRPQLLRQVHEQLTHGPVALVGTPRCG